MEIRSFSVLPIDLFLSYESPHKSLLFSLFSPIQEFLVPLFFMSFTANVIDISYLTIASFPACITAEAMAHFSTINVFICHLTIDFNLNSNQALNASNYLETFGSCFFLSFQYRSKSSNGKRT